MGLTPRRFAAIADIHGNVDALRAVLADIAGQGITDIVNLGDLLSSPLAAAETLAVLRARPMLTVRGNHDRWLVDQPPNQMDRSDRLAHDQLTADDLTWLRALPPTAMLGTDVFLCHATPGDDLTYWLEEVTPDGRISQRPRADVAALLRGITAPLVLCGHTHTARAVRIGGQVIVNPGSVGQPGYDDDVPYRHVMQSGTPDASYAILENSPLGWAATFRHVRYDASRMVALAQANGSSHWVSALQTGWWAQD